MLNLPLKQIATLVVSKGSDPRILQNAQFHRSADNPLSSFFVAFADGVKFAQSLKAGTPVTEVVEILV